MLKKYYDIYYYYIYILLKIYMEVILLKSIYGIFIKFLTIHTWHAININIEELIYFNIIWMNVW